MTLERGSKRLRRRLTEEEHKLWNGIARSVSPLKRKKTVPPRHQAAAKTEHTKLLTSRCAEAGHAPLPVAVVKPARSIASLGGLDRRQRRRLARGVEEIDARIDLHGKTQSEAHAALLAFLERAHRQGARFVLVITGKGALSATGNAAGRGVLKRQVPLWLRQAEFRAYVLAAEDAHRAHGGEGALYIRLRRSTKPPTE